MLKKAILTGGGRATRLRPITTNFNKHLIPLANKPMIFHAIEKVVEAGVEEIFINTNAGETMLQKKVGDGSRWGVTIKYFEQVDGPQGIAHVVNCAKDLVRSEPFIFYLSDNIILGSIKHLVKKFEEENLDSLLTLSKVPDPERFGVPEFDSAGNLVELYEKPEQPPSDFAVTGIYIFNSCFFEAFKNIEKSARGEYEITSGIYSYLLKNGYKLGYQEITGWWKDTGKAMDLITANKLLLDEFKPENFKQEADVSNVQISGQVGVGKQVVFGRNVKLKGPVLIGPGSQLENCTLGPYVTVNGGDSIKNIELKNSIVFGNCEIDGHPTGLNGVILEQKGNLVCLIINKDSVLQA